jgi:hypothetical protein
MAKTRSWVPLISLGVSSGGWGLPFAEPCTRASAGKIKNR